MHAHACPDMYTYAYSDPHAQTSIRLKYILETERLIYTFY